MGRYARLAAFVCLSSLALANLAGAETLKTLRVGLGTGTITSSVAGISCGTDCDENFPSGANVTLTVTADADSTFVEWRGDCTGATCNLVMSANKAVKAVFSANAAVVTMGPADLTPAGLAAYLTAHPDVNSIARFTAALPADFRKNWIMMSRSESLQTGTAKTPRFLLPNANAQNVFTFGLMRHTSYPGADPLAIEYMQWDPAEKNFRFHEVVLGPIPALGAFPARIRSVSADDARCTKCHSTRNVPNPGPFPGTTGLPIGSVKSKNKPNWDTYDSWGGMLPFNRDRIYRGTVEEEAFRKIFNLWNWRADDTTRAFIEQLDLQPDGAASVHPITRVPSGADEGAIVFGYDASAPGATTPSPTAITYQFNNAMGPAPGQTVQQGGDFVTLHHSAIPGSDEGRGVRFFDALGGLVGGAVNQLRIADEVATHRYATGSVYFDPRPLALAIAKNCLSRNSGTNTVVGTSALTLNQAFFSARHGGMTINDVYNDTLARTQSVPRRKADIQKINLHRAGDVYIRDVADEVGLIAQHSADASTANDRLQREVFRRPTAGFGADATVMGGVYVDRETYFSNSESMALYRFFLEPLGVSVDKWSMGVRGRSRTYSFADVFSTYTSALQSGLESSLVADPIPGLPGTSCSQLITQINASSAALPAATAVPTYTDVQRIFNKGCIECHGGLAYPPFDKYHPADYLDLSEDETNSAGDRLRRAYDYAVMFTSMDPNPTNSYLYQRITMASESCPGGVMPCGGPALGKVDIETIGRWIAGARPYTNGDPHLKTVDGTNYDFQGAGEFTLLRGEGMEIQTRQTPVETDGPLGANGHTGLSSCVSINTATAIRVGSHRITYQPGLGNEPSREGLELRVDGKLTRLPGGGLNLSAGGRILPTTAGGIQIEYQGGTDIVVTPGFWDYYGIWYLNIDVRRARATEGVMGAIAPLNWLPTLPDGTFPGPRPEALAQRYQDLYVRFADAWRVADGTSLFDYAPGKSTANYTLPGWPGFAPRSCKVPKNFSTSDKPPVKALPIEMARAACRAVIEAERRANCEADVMITGDAGFARTYLATEKIQLNEPPKAPQLLLPANDAIDLTSTVDFSWIKTVDSDGGKLTYRHCVWVAGEPITFDQCSELPRVPALLEGNNLWILLLVLVILLVLVLIAAVRSKHHRGRLLILALVLVALILLALYYGTRTQMATSATQLQAGKAYFWKVMVEDGQGGTNESELRRFTLK